MHREAVIFYFDTVINWKLIPRISAVSYLNTSPLVWGMLHGPQRDAVEVRFALPSECADQVRSGEADIGIIPAIEVQRQGLDWLPETGIASRGAVRSLFLISKVEPSRIRTLATDVGSRTTVMLSRILLAEQHGVEPELIPRKADLPRMLAIADAAVIIGDAALLLDPVALSRDYFVADVGEQWMRLTGLPMVYAVWSGRKENLPRSLAGLFVGSYRYGAAHLEDIIQQEAGPRGIPADLAREYLTRYVVCELGDKEREGLQTFWRFAREFEKVTV